MKEAIPYDAVAEDIDDEVVLADLPDGELVEQMHDDLYDGLMDEIVEGTQILLDRGWSAEKVLNEAMVEGMRIVGIDFRDGILFVPEVLLAANAMKGGMEMRPASNRSARWLSARSKATSTTSARTLSR
jgi:methanogenic corrinoid protein MtbC1